MTLAEIRSWTRIALGQPSAATSDYTDAEVDVAIGLGYVFVVVAAELLMDISVENSNTVNEGIYNKPPDSAMIRRVYYQGRDEKLQERTIEQLDLEDTGWRLRVADSGTQPAKWAPMGQFLRLVPQPFESGKEIEVWSIAAPAPLVLPGDIPTIPSAYHEGIALAAAIRLHMSDYTNQAGINAARTLLTPQLAAILMLAQSHRDREGEPKVLKDIRDFYPSEWRP